MRSIFIFVFVVAFLDASAQYTMPPYTIQKDGPAHTLVFHSALSDKYEITNAARTDTLQIIAPDIKITNGMVDHKTMLGDMIAREYFVDSIMIGYIEYDGPSFRRERYLYPDGRVFLDKKYDQGTLIHINTKVYRAKKK